MNIPVPVQIGVSAIMGVGAGVGTMMAFPKAHIAWPIATTLLGYGGTRVVLGVVTSTGNALRNPGSGVNA